MNKQMCSCMTTILLSTLVGVWSWVLTAKDMQQYKQIQARDTDMHNEINDKHTEIEWHQSYTDLHQNKNKNRE